VGSEGISDLSLQAKALMVRLATMDGKPGRAPLTRRVGCGDLAPFQLKEAAMGFDKGHHEFHTVDMQAGWQTIPGYPPGFSEKILAGSLDEKNKRGNRTRMLRIEAGAFSTKPFVHDYWEEVFLLSGDLVVDTDEHGEGGEQFHEYTYAVRPPGVYHGPFASRTGCMLLETHYFDENK
jgi:ChrR Cupin-like domain